MSICFGLFGANSILCSLDPFFAGRSTMLIIYYLHGPKGRQQLLCLQRVAYPTVVASVDAGLNSRRC